MATVSHHTASASGGTASSGMPGSSRARRRKAPTTRSSSSWAGSSARSTSARGSLKQVSSTRSPSSHACCAQARARRVLPVPAPPRTTTRRFWARGLSTAIWASQSSTSRARVATTRASGSQAKSASGQRWSTIASICSRSSGWDWPRERASSSMASLASLQVGGHEDLGADDVRGEVAVHGAGVGEGDAVLDPEVLEGGRGLPQPPAQGVGVLLGLVDRLRVERRALLADPGAVLDRASGGP